MKKIRVMALILAAALAVLPLSGCREVIQVNNGLTIYASAETINYWNRVLNGYRYAYPDVAVDLVDLSDLTEREFSERLAGELMSGHGPDLFIVGEEFMKQRDIYKLMDSGAFADITKEISSHPELGNGDGEGISKSYNQIVMEQGVWKGKRYLLPICYRIPILLTSQGILDESGFDMDQCGDLMGFIREAKPFVEAKENDLQAPRLFGGKAAFRNYAFWIGDGMFDYEGRRVTVDTPEFREASEFYRSLYAQEQEFVRSEDSLERWVFERNQKRLFENYERDIFSFHLCAAFVQGYDRAVTFPMRTVDGGIPASIVQAFAVNGNSPNVENACNFIDIALKKYQYAGMTLAIPVLNAYASDILGNITMPELVWYYSGYYEDERGNPIELSGFDGDFSPLPEEFMEEFVSWTQSISCARFYTPEQEKLYELMTPYYKGEADYETCIKKAQEQLTLYMTE